MERKSKYFGVTEQPKQIVESLVKRRERMYVKMKGKEDNLKRRRKKWVDSILSKNLRFVRNRDLRD